MFKYTLKQRKLPKNAKKKNTYKIKVSLLKSTYYYIMLHMDRIMHLGSTVFQMDRKENKKKKNFTSHRYPGPMIISYYLLPYVVARMRGHTWKYA